jgi:SAM-dependent methyltransferase
MDDSAARNREVYDRAPEREWRRVDERFHARLEYEVSSHALRRHLPPPDDSPRVLDAGGGPGRYTIDLAGQGYRVTLLDLSPSLLEFARARIAEAGAAVERNVEAVIEASIVDLSALGNGEFGGVLCLGGVLSHVTNRGLRRRALGELGRVAKPGAPLLISGMNRLSAYRGAVQWPDDFDRNFPSEDGYGTLLNGAEVYEFAPEEFTWELVEAGLEVERVYGSAGIAAHLPEGNLEALRESPERWRRWQAAFLATCDHPSIVGMSPHLLAVARRR